MKIQAYLLTLFVIKSNIGKSKANSANLKIDNLNVYLDTFADCLIHIVNYNGIDFHPFKYPVVLSRYHIVQIVQVFQRGNTTTYSERYYGDFSKREIEHILKILKYKSHCDIHLYIYPPPENTFYNHKTDYPKLSIPYAYYTSALITNGRYGTSNLIFSRRIYHILLTHQNASIVRWNFAMSDVLRFYPGVDFVVLETNKVNVISVKLGCKHCEEYRRQFVPMLLESKLNRTYLDKMFRNLNEQGFGKKWVATSETIDETLIYKGYEPILDLWNSALERYKSVIPFMDFKRVKTENKIATDQILFALVVPNVTFVTLTNPCKKLKAQFPYRNNANLTTAILLKSGICDEYLYRPEVTFDKYHKVSLVRQTDRFTFLA